MSQDELELVEWLRGRQPHDPAVRLGIGDDMAVLKSSSDCMLVSSDLLLDGVHFESRRHAPAQIGRKAVARSLSDCAAMAVRPLAAVVSVALPHKMILGDAKELFDGIFAGAAEFAVPIVGGDTARWNNPLAVDVTVIAGPFPGVNPVTRSGARIGDQILVTGTLGGSLRGRHMTFVPRIAEARLVAERLGGDLHAMIDISDGLSLDLWRLCQASGVGAVLDERQLLHVVSEDAKRVAEADNRSPLEHALSDGEDYELLIAVSPGVATTGLPLNLVGRVVKEGLALTKADATIEPLTPKGYIH